MDFKNWENWKFNESILLGTFTVETSAFAIIKFWDWSFLASMTEPPVNLQVSGINSVPHEPLIPCITATSRTIHCPSIGSIPRMNKNGPQAEKIVDRLAIKNC